jgi:hypothetical protein
MATPAILAPVQAKQQVLADLRTTLRRLAASRILERANDPVTLAQLVDQAFREEFPSTKSDNRQAAAIARGIPARRKLTEAEGGSFSAEEAAREIGISKQAILKRYQKGQLIAWREERQNAVRFPVWQFHERGVLRGIEETLQSLNAGNRLDDYGRVLFFLSNHGYLQGKRPLDCLREGEIAKVVHAAQAYVE